MIVDQLFTPKPLKEGGPYDLPGKDYDRPGDTPRKAPASDEHNPYPFSPEEDDDYFREIFRKKREAAAKDQGVAEDYRDSPRAGIDPDFDSLLLRRDARRKGMTVAQYKHYLATQDQDREYELTIGPAARAELKRQADEIAELKRQQLRQERLEDEAAAHQRYTEKAEREMEMEKIRKAYQHELNVINNKHTNSLQTLNAENSHDIRKLSIQQQHELTMLKANQPERPTRPQRPGRPQRPTAEPEDDFEPEPEISVKPAPMTSNKPSIGNANFDSETGKPLKPQQWHTSQQLPYKKPPALGYKNDDDVTDIEPKKLGETGIDRAVNDKGLTQQRWLQLVQTKFPDAKIVCAKMIDGPCRATLPDGKTLSWVKVDQGTDGNNNSTGGVKPVGTGKYKALQTGIDQRKAARDKMQAYVATLPTYTRKGMSESKRNKQRRLNEALLMEDPVYRRFKRVGRYIAEQKLTEPEILQIFSDAEAGMTDKATGANRTFAGRGKDATVDFAKDVAGAVKGVLNSIQNSVPVAAVDTAYDQATDALGDLAGGQKGAVMDAIKKYRNLVKQYPKTAGFAKAALVAIAGLATGGAGLPAIAGLTYALDSANKGDKLSSVIGKGAGAAALAAAGQAIHGGATQTGPADTNAFTNVNQMGDHTGEYVDMPDGSDIVSPLVAPPPELATYTVQSGDTLSQIAQANNTTVQELVGLNPQLAAASGAIGGQGLNPDVIFPGQQITLPPATPGADVYAGAVGTNANTMADIARGQVPNSAITQGMAARNAVRESIKYRARILHADKLIDQKATVLNWALSESVGRKSKSVNLTTLGTYTVFENIDRYRRAILEATQPGRPELPDQYRPDLPGGAGVQSQPGMIGRGLNWLDNKAKAVGGALSNFGHQFTTNVTKEKLKMNWHQAGKPSDSDQLAAWLVGQGVPQQVVTSVFGKMGIPYTAPTTVQPAGQSDEPTATSTATRQMPWYGKDANGKVRDSESLRARGNAELVKRGLPNMANATSQVAKDIIAQTGGEPLLSQPTATTTPAITTTTTAAGQFPGEDPNGPGYVGRREVARRQAARAAQTSTTPAKPNFAQQGGGYKSVNYAPNIKTGVGLPKPTTPAAPITTVSKGGLDKKTQDYINAINAKQPASLAENRIAIALKQPVAEMLQMVETKEDVQKIKQFVDQTFARYGAVNESAFALRNQILEHITQVGAQRRREHSQKVAH